VSWVERIVEERLAQAARDGELSAPHLEGKPLAGLAEQRPPGWWADQFVQRELSHDRRQAAEAAAARARAGFWHATSVDDLRARVREANQAITRANVNLVEPDRLPLFDPADVEARWRRLR
jgi:hypothetical protein